MTTTQHTRGPWAVRNDQNEWAIIGPEPSWITDVDKLNHNAEANARLIAAAPDLLKSLKCFLKISSQAELVSWKTNAERAIAKAEGR